MVVAAALGSFFLRETGADAREGPGVFGPSDAAGSARDRIPAGWNAVSA
jgi:hypothetical protein